jgi:hypothetical protein
VFRTNTPLDLWLILTVVFLVAWVAVRLRPRTEVRDTTERVALYGWVTAILLVGAWSENQTFLRVGNLVAAILFGRLMIIGIRDILRKRNSSP